MKSKWIAVTSALLLFLSSGAVSHAAERNSFWSDAMPTQTCYDGQGDAKDKLGLVIDGERVSLNAQTCDEARKSRVLVQVNDQYLHIVAGTGAEPFVEKGRTMIPLKALADAFGFEVKWDQSEKKITLTKENMIITMIVGKTEILVNGNKLASETAPMVKNNVTFLPVRELAEVLGIEVKWDQATRTATFNEK